MVPLFGEPTDQLVFATRTYHAAFPNRIDRVRLSCGVGFRPKAYKIDAPWPLPDTAKAFIKALPERYQHYVEEYTGIQNDWRPDDAEPQADAMMELVPSVQQRLATRSCFPTINDCFFW